LLKAHAPKNVNVVIAVGNEGKVMVGDAEQLESFLKSGIDSRSHTQLLHFPEEDHATILHNAAYKALIAANKTIQANSKK